MENYEIEACFLTDHGEITTTLSVKTMVHADGVENATMAAWTFVLGRIHNLKHVGHDLRLEWVTVHGYVIGTYDPGTKTLPQSYRTMAVYEWKKDQLGASDEKEKWIGRCQR